MWQINEDEEIRAENLREPQGLVPSSAIGLTDSDQDLRPVPQRRRRRSSIVMPSSAVDDVQRAASHDTVPQDLMQSVVQSFRPERTASTGRTPSGASRREDGETPGMSDWDHLYWAAMAGTSPTLQLCRDIDGHVIVLLEDFAELAAWRQSVFEKRELPLPEFTRLSTICSRLSRGKVTLTNSVSFLLAQVRALLVEATNEESLQLQRELQLRRNDPSMHLEEEIEQLASELENSQIEMHELKHLKNWERIIMTIEFQLFEQGFRDKLQKSLTKYIKHVKDKNTIGNLWETDEKGGGRETTAPSKTGKKGASKGKASVRQQAILKREADKIEKHQATLKKREEKLSFQQERFREAYREFEASKSEMEKKIQGEREFVRSSRLAQDKMAIILDQRKKELDSEREKINVNFHKKAEELAERENEVDARFPELSKLESQIAEQIRNLHRTAANNLRSLNNPQSGEEAARIAAEALKFAHEHAKGMKGHFDNLTIHSTQGSRESSRKGSRESIDTVDVGVQWDESDDGLVILVQDRSNPDDTSSQPDVEVVDGVEANKQGEADAEAVDGVEANKEEEEEDWAIPISEVLEEEGEERGTEVLEEEGQEGGKRVGEETKAVEEDEKVAVEDESANSEENPPPDQDEAAKGAAADEESRTAEAEALAEVQPPSVQVAAIGRAESVVATVLECSSTPAVVLEARVQSPAPTVQVDERELELKDEEIAALQEQCRELEQRVLELEEQEALRATDDARGVKDKEEIAALKDQCSTLEKRVRELNVLSEEEEAAIRARRARQQIELDLEKHRLETERKAFEDHVKSFTRSEEDKNLLLLKLDQVARIKQAKELADDFEALVARRAMVEKQEEDAVKARSELMEREETVRELALKVEHALEQADSEQKEFEESIMERNRVLREKELELKRREDFIKMEEGKEVNVLRKELHDQADAKQAELKQKEANLAKLEQSLVREIEKLRANAQTEVGKLLQAERLELEKREGLLEARLHNLDVQLAKVQEAGQGRKLLTEAEARMAKADARMGEAATKEIELRAAVTTLEIQQEALKAAQQSMLGASSGDEWKLKSEYEAKVRSLHLQMKDYKSQIKALRAQLARQESRELLRLKRSQAHDLAHTPNAEGATGEEGPGWNVADMERPLTPIDGSLEDYPGMAGSFGSPLVAGPEEQWATMEGPEREFERVRELQEELREKMRGMEAERKMRQREYEEKMVRVKQREKAMEGGPHREHMKDIELAERRHKDAMNALQIKHETAREKLKAKTEAVRAACAEVEGQLAHLKSIRASEAKLVQHAQQLFHGLDADLSGLDGNILALNRLANDKNINLKHLSTLLEVYRIKTANLDGAIKQRKRNGEVDPRSALPREAVDNVDAAVALKVDAVTNREQGFIMQASRPADGDEEQQDSVTLHVVQPKLFERSHAGGGSDEEDTVEALPAIFLPASRARQSGKKMGGGFGGSLAANRALMRHTVSAPTGERKTKLDYFSMQGAVVQTTDTPGPASPVKHAA